jgi:hypothetical protein
MFSGSIALELEEKIRLEEMQMISKIATWIVWTALAVVVTVFVFRHTDLVTPASSQANAENRSLAFALLDKTSSSRATTGSSESKLENAREAFFHGNDDEAIKLYNEYIKNNAKNPDVRGELGNAYYASGRLIDAAGAYYDAAKLLLAAQRYPDVEFLLPIIAELQPMLADELKMKLNAATGSQMAVPTTSSVMLQRAPQSALTRY